MSSFTAVLFDNGNTLFYKPHPAPAIVALAGRLGARVEETSAREAWLAVKAHKRTLRQEAIAWGRNRSAEGHQEYYTACYAPLEALAPGLADAFYGGFKTNPESMVPYPDTAAVLAALHGAGVKIGIVSNTGWNIREGYRRHGLDRYVDSFVLSYEHGVAKPEVTLFQTACSELGVEPDHTLMVGNNAVADSGAAAAGCTSLVLPEVSRGEPRGLEAVLRLVGIDQPTALRAA